MAGGEGRTTRRRTRYATCGAVKTRPSTTSGGRGTHPTRCRSCGTHTPSLGWLSATMRAWCCSRRFSVFHSHRHGGLAHARAPRTCTCIRACRRTRTRARARTRTRTCTCSFHVHVYVCSLCALAVPFRQCTARACLHAHGVRAPHGLRRCCTSSPRIPRCPMALMTKVKASWPTCPSTKSR